MPDVSRFPLGLSNYRKLVSNDYIYIDKTLAIKDIVRDGADIIVLTRPRRFGKTLFLSMLHHFFASDVDGDTSPLFETSLLKQQVPELCQKHQGKYEVINISLKDIKQETYKSTLSKLRDLVSTLFLKHSHLLKTNKLNLAEKEYFEKFTKNKCNNEELQNSLLHLSRYLKKAYQKEVIILIDEYDTPITHSYLKNYYPSLIKFMQGFFSAALKDNDACHKAVVTGILRIAKESLFSDLNNAEIYTILNQAYSAAFGFTSEEVDYLITQTNTALDKQAIKNWYDGYLIGKQEIFNPWSIIQCLKTQGQLFPYWINTSSNDLIIHTLAKTSSYFKVDLQALLQSKTVEVPINLHMHLNDLSNNDDAFWSLLYFSGYLTGTPTSVRALSQLIAAKIPNREILLFMQNIITSWFSNTLGTHQHQQMLTELTKGNVERFTITLKKFLAQTMSYFDVSGNEPERFYHGLVLGLVASLQNSYNILSNRESGYGRYDAALIPLDKTKIGIIFEFKSEENPLKLEKAADIALKQINKNQYITTLKQSGVTTILKLGMAFYRKKVAIKSGLEKLDTRVAVWP